MSSEPVIRYEPDPEMTADMDRWRRKPRIVHAKRQSAPFEVLTLEGTMRGHPGDWLVVGTAGELYPVAHHIFVASFEPVVEQ